MEATAASDNDIAEGGIDSLDCSLSSWVGVNEASRLGDPRSGESSWDSKDVFEGATNGEDDGDGLDD